MYQGSRAKRRKSTSAPTISWNSGENHWVLATKSNSETPARAAPRGQLEALGVGLAFAAGVHQRRRVVGVDEVG